MGPGSISDAKEKWDSYLDPIYRELDPDPLDSVGKGEGGPLGHANCRFVIV